MLDAWRQHYWRLSESAMLGRREPTADFVSCVATLDGLLSERSAALVVALIEKSDPAC